MYGNLQIKLKNTLEELKSFPIEQSLFLEFSESVEDAFLKEYIFLVQGIDSPGLIHIGDSYNQNIGIVKETFKNIDTNISVIEQNPFTVKVSPLKPLTPGYSYTLLVRGELPNEHLTIEKTVSHSSSTIILLSSIKQNIEEVLTINTDSNLSNGKHIVDVSIGSVRKTFDITKNKEIVLDGYQLKLPSMLYLEGEVFNILVTDKTTQTNSYTVSLVASPSKNVKTTDPTNNSKLTFEDILKYNADQDSLIVEEELTYEIKHTGINSFIILFNKAITDKLDFDMLTHTQREAFGMYTLTAMKLYNPLSTYTVTYSIIDKKSVEFFIKEDVL